MERISSFCADHTKILPGIYKARVDDDITTYDLRTRRPNAGNYMNHVTMHTFEHMFATFARNSELAQKVIYFGPMGCQTGFYLLIRNASDNETAAVIADILKKIIQYEGEVFGSSLVECGNYENLLLSSAQTEAKEFLAVLEKSGQVKSYE